MSDATNGAGFATLAIHAGAQPDLALTLPSYLVPGRARGDGDVHWSRSCPACATLEERVATLEGGTAALAVGSGPGARMLALHTLMQPGDELVAARRSDASAIEAALRRFGRHVRWVDAGDPESFVEALSDRTKAILVDSITDGGDITDIEAIATIARRARVPLAVDNSLATPYLVRPFEHGADIVLYTTTAVLAGHAGARGGLIVDGGAFAFAGDDRYPALSQATPADGDLVIAETYGNFAFAMGARLGLRELGGALAPLDAALTAGGIETLALRLRHQCECALAVARHLERHPRVTSVRYAGLERDADHPLALRYCPGGAGIVLSFEGEATGLLAERLRLFASARGPGGARSLVLASSERAAGRLSIGLEDAADIIADLNRALAG